MTHPDKFAIQPRIKAEIFLTPFIVLEMDCKIIFFLLSTLVVAVSSSPFVSEVTNSTVNDRKCPSYMFCPPGGDPGGDVTCCLHLDGNGWCCPFHGFSKLNQLIGS